jgi:hypothetical protein
MNRKDSDKDAERPHYYSQFWLDIAAGRRVIGGPRPEENEAGEPEAPEPVPARKVGRADAARVATAVPPVELAIEEDEEPEDVLEENELPNIVLEGEDEDSLDEDDLSVEEDEDFFGDEEEEEEEDEDGGEWGRRGRKKAKPARPVRPVTKPKRAPRRGTF